ncbi:SGNH/GDSL hydrolase family protein [Candidatus Solincola sp.]
MTGRKLLVVGDSLAGGFPHLCFPALLRQLDPSWEITVSARGGDTLLGAGNRLAELLSGRRPDAVLLVAGANDLLLPFLESRGGTWKILVKRLVSRGSVPAARPEAFRALLERVVKAARGRAGSVILASVPCLGEDLHSHLNRRREEYNRVIAETALVAGARLADLAEPYERELKRLENPSSYLLGCLSDAFLDPLRSLTPCAAFQLSGRRGLLLTLDGVHPNPRGARILAEKVAAALSPIS